MKTALTFATLFTALVSVNTFALGKDAPVGRGPVTEAKNTAALNIDHVVSRTDNSDKDGIVPAELVYVDKQGQVHTLQFLEVGGRTSPSS